MRVKIPRGSVALRLLAVMALPCLLAAIYLLTIRPSQLHWGAAAEEVSRAMPGDELVPAPHFCATRGVTIHGTPQQIWPWLAQMGYRRAGFYGYDLIENLGSETGIRSATTILANLQHPKPGDTLPISVVASMTFGSIQPGSYLIWRGKASIPSDGSFVWALYPVDQSHTRLVSRARLRYHWTEPGLLLLDLFTEFADHVAVPRILLGIKAHVEGARLQSLAEEAVEIAVWLLVMAELTAAMVLVVLWQRWGRAWLLGLASGLLLLFVLYARAPVWIDATMALAAMGTLIQLLRAGAGDRAEL